MVREYEWVKKGFDAKDAINVKKDDAKIKDLESLKTQEIPGPFTLNVNIDKFIESNIVSNIDKQNPLYMDVRYSKTTHL